MMRTPLISILIPTYQSDKTLRRTLDSLVSQEFGDWEAWIIDGVSKDGTMDIIHEYAAGNNRIHFISEPDQGIYDAMNKGVRLATGQWIYFLGSDDHLYDPGVLGSFGEDLTDNNLDLVYGNIVTDRNSRPYDGEFTMEKLLRNNISHQAIFYRRNIFDKFGSFNTRYKSFADWDLNIRCFSDPGIRTKYRDRIIAEFGLHGVSRRYDIAFLREVLIPARLHWLERAGHKSLRPVFIFDDWWRLVRNAGIRSLGEAPGNTMDPVIRHIIGWQRGLPLRMLENGVVSKCWMIMSYCHARIKGVI
jgi:glycosyltransferase involved in cell wall biosynthesis